MDEGRESTLTRSRDGAPSRRRRSAGEPFARVRDSEGKSASHTPDTDAGRELFRAAAELIAVAGRR